jgi:hypothetical protein
MKLCSRDNCKRPVKARGMCDSHYNTWHRKLTTKLGFTDSKDAILSAMPGTKPEIAAKLRMQYQTVRLAIQKMHLAGECHIEDEQPTEHKRGSRYLAIYAAGPGQDRVMSRQAKTHHSRTLRAEYLRLRHVGKRTDPLVAALFGVRA